MSLNDYLVYAEQWVSLELTFNNIPITNFGFFPIQLIADKLHFIGPLPADRKHASDWCNYIAICVPTDTMYHKLISGWI